MSTINTFASWEQYLIYLRKSRQDDPRETVEEVLEKHETMLQEYAVREFGHKIPEANIYREVVSGESIAEREEIQAVLARINDPDIKGVLVVEPSRLSRGDLTDCGHLIDAFRYSNTLVVTPYMTYDLNNKMERKFFQDELLRGNDYLEYTKEILWRGRVAAAKRGCYSSGGPAPFGYKKVKVEKDWILEAVPEDAEVVRLIFDWYTREGLTPCGIGRKLDSMGVKPPSGKGRWKSGSIRKILSNRHYLGLIVFNRVKATTVIEEGEKVKRLVKQKPEDIIIAKGKHPAIIDADIFDAAQELIPHPPKNQSSKELKNVLASLLVCGKCGYVMTRNATKGLPTRYICKAHDNQCFKSEKEDVVLDALVVALESSELPALKLKIKNDEGSSVKLQQRQVEKLRAQLIEFEQQEDRLHDLLEQGVYTPEVFSRRHATLLSKMEACREEMDTIKRSIPKSINFQERAETLERAIALMKDPTVTAAEKNKLLKSVISRVEYHGSPVGALKYRENNFSLKVFLRF